MEKRSSMKDSGLSSLFRATEATRMAEEQALAAAAEESRLTADPASYAAESPPGSEEAAEPAVETRHPR